MEVIQLTPGVDAGEARVRFAGTDAVFFGHFPQAPVLPGVVLIDTAVRLVSSVMKRPLRLERLSNVKFCRAVLPDEEITFAFKATRADDGSERIKVSGRWFREAEKIADLVFMAVPDENKGGVR